MDRRGDKPRGLIDSGPPPLPVHREWPDLWVVDNFPDMERTSNSSVLQAKNAVTPMLCSQTNRHHSQYLQTHAASSVVAASQQDHQIRPMTGKTYPIRQNTGNDIKHQRLDYGRIPGRRWAKDSKFTGCPVLGPITVRVHDKDEKNPLVHSCGDPTDDIAPIAGRLSRTQNNWAGKGLT